MSKILINNTASPIPISDTGVTLQVTPNYTIPAQDYLLWAASSDIITQIGSGDVIVNDGSTNLSISDGTDLIKDIFPKKMGVLSGDDLTQIGHVTDKLKVIDEDSITVLNQIAIAVGAGSGLSVFKQNEAAVTSRTKFDLSGTTYTVPTGKKFLLTSFSGSYDAQAALYLRLEKQTGGTGSFVTQFRMTMMSGGQGNSTISMEFGNGIVIGLATDVFKLTVESSIAKGTIWGQFAGSEI